MSDLEIRLLPSARASFRTLADLVKWATKLDFAYAWIDTGAERSEVWHTLDEDKIHRGIVGLHFAGTDPAALEFFDDEAHERVRVILDTDGTFHPKVIVGIRGTARRAIIGSSNFTPSGFETNTELNVFVSGNDDADFFRNLDAVIADYWFRSTALTPKLFRNYRRKWDRRPRPPVVHARDIAQQGPPGTESELNVGWREYVQLLRFQANRGVHVISSDPELHTYVEESERARLALQAAGSFSSLSYPAARQLAGYGPRAGYFGSIRANGVVMRMVKSERERLAPLVDPIPESGAVADDLVKSVFAHAERLPRVGMAVVTRFLTIKRPDLFFPINNANSRRIRELLGSVPKDVDEYLDMVRQVRRLPWAQSPRPQDRVERRLWNARVGLLDAVVYEPK